MAEFNTAHIKYRATRREEHKNKCKFKITYFCGKILIFILFSPSFALAANSFPKLHFFPDLFSCLLLFHHLSISYTYSSIHSLSPCNL